MTPSITTPFVNTSKGTPTKNKTLPIYATLPPQDQSNLLIITHFIHVHYNSLNLSAYDLLTPVEESILSQSGKVHANLMSRILYQPSKDDYLESLREAIEELACTGRFRDCCSVNNGGIINSNTPVHASARPMSVHDSRGMKYVWIRGSSGVSTRFLAGVQVLNDPLKHAEYLQRRGGRKDVFVSGWIVSRVESAERKASAIRQDHEKEMIIRKQSEENEKLRKKEKVRRMERLCSTLGQVLQGGRRRRTIQYIERDHDDDHEDDVGSGVEESGDDEFVVSEEALDGGSGEDSCGSMSEDSERDGDVVVGRVRVQVSERAKRVAKRAERLGNGKRLRSGKVMNDVDDERIPNCRRSKRLRGISA